MSACQICQIRTAFLPPSALPNFPNQLQFYLHFFSYLSIRCSKNLKGKKKTFLKFLFFTLLTKCAEKRIDGKNGKFLKMQYSIFFQDSNFTGCQTKLPTPSYNQVECQRFLRMAREEYETWPNIDEFEIYQKSNLKRLARCYRTHSDLGWCGVNLSDDISLVSH